jgi:hypothetical protein
MSLLSSQQLQACGFKNGPNGKISRKDQTTGTLLETAIRMGILEVPSTPNVNTFVGLFPSEITAIADVVGLPVNSKPITLLERAAVRVTLDGVLRRTDRANETLIAAAAAGEDLPPDREDPTDLMPLAGLVIDQAALDHVADQYENVLVMDSKILQPLDPFRRARRCVRQIVRILGARPSTRVRHAYHWGMSLSNAVVGTAAIDVAARALEHAMTTNQRFSNPMERFWQASALVLRALGADVQADVNAMWDAETAHAQQAPSAPLPALFTEGREEMPF